MNTRTLFLLSLAVISSLNFLHGESAEVRMSTRNLMPVPAAMRQGSARLKLGETLTISVVGYSDARLLAGVSRMARRMEARTGVLVNIKKGPSDDAKLVIECLQAGEKIPSLGEDESYSLEVTEQKATLGANSVVGVLRGLETLLQLVDAQGAYYFVPAVSIQDKPRFPWRGLMIDVSRHFEPVEVIKRNLDAMAAVKMNVFHWHLTDDQGFRIESKKFPKLHEMGSDGLYYTQEQVRDVIGYAKERGIRVIPEFDLPGHATSWFVGYPDLASAPGPYAIERNFGIFDPTMDPTREETYEFLDTFLAEMATLFEDKYVHIGGDENNGNQWSRNPKIVGFMKSRGMAGTPDLQSYFNQRVLSILTKHGKTMVAWNDAALPAGIVVQAWTGLDPLNAAVKSGFSAVHSGPFYLDHFHTSEFHYLSDPVSRDAGLKSEEEARILGGEAPMWGEYVYSETIDSRIWPRTAVIAERLWSPASVRDVDDVYRRLDAVSTQLEELGLTHRTNPERLFRSIAQQEDVTPFRTLADASEPLNLAGRQAVQNDTQLTALNRFGDIIAPESPIARKLTKMTEAFLADAPQYKAYRTELSAIFTQWQDCVSRMKVATEQSPRLSEINDRASELGAIGNIGLQAISFLVDGTKAPKGWKATQLALLDEAAKPKAMIRFPWLESIRQLVLASSR